LREILPRQTDDGEEDYSELIGKIADAVVVRQLTVPAIVFLESVKPLAFLGNQLMIFLNPMVSLIVASEDYYRFVRMIENRDNVEKLIETIEDTNARRQQAQRERREQRRRERGRRGFLGIFRRRSKAGDKEGDGSGQQGDNQNPGD
jgi:hypothetical protein